MSSYFIKGFVGAMPEMKAPRGIPVTTFIIAVNCGPVDKPPKKLWVKCVAWRNLAEAVREEIFAGDLVAINGRIEDMEAWIDQKSRKAQARLVIRVDEIAKRNERMEFVAVRHKRSRDDTGTD